MAHSKLNKTQPSPPNSAKKQTPTHKNKCPTHPTNTHTPSKIKQTKNNQHKNKKKDTNPIRNIANTPEKDPSTNPETQIQQKRTPITQAKNKQIKHQKKIKQPD